MIIPVALTVVMVFFAASLDKSDEKKIFNSHKKSQFSKQILSYKPNRPKKDYKTIYSFIKDNYRKVSEQDAKLISKYLVEFGHQYKIDPKLLAALVSQESSFNKQAVSSTGAKGLGQIKSFNYKALNIKNPFDIKQNIRGTAQYIKEMIAIWKHDNNAVELAFASYFKGAQAVKNMNQKIDEESHKYVNGILEKYKRIKQ